MSKILVVGSVAYDTIETPYGKKEGILGGSANYFSLAAAQYAPVNVVGVVGEDYQDKDLEILSSRGVNLDGLQKVGGETFRWTGKYEADMNEAITLDTQLNVFKDFDPKLPEGFKGSEYLFLANIDPKLQMSVLNQAEQPKFVGVDTMNFWIDSQLDDLKAVLGKVDALLINEKEARSLTETFNIIGAMKKLSDMGPKAVVVKRGEYGFVLYCRGEEHPFFVLPAYPVDRVQDPTGAGDTFAGGFFGYLAKVDEPISMQNLKEACVHGCLFASFTVQDFGVDRIKSLDWSDIEKRHSLYNQVIGR